MDYITDNTYQILQTLIELDQKASILYNGIYILFTLSSGLIIFYLFNKFLNVFRR